MNGDIYINLPPIVTCLIETAASLAMVLKLPIVEFKKTPAANINIYDIAEDDSSWSERWTVLFETASCINIELEEDLGLIVALGEPDLSVFCNINITFPSLVIETNLINPSLISLDFSLGWPTTSDLWSMSLRGGHSLSGELFIPEVSIHKFSESLIDIISELDLLSVQFNVSSEILSWMSIDLPALQFNQEVISENISYIAGAIPLTRWDANLLSGTVNTINSNLPFLYYESTGFANGLFQLNITLPCLITDSLNLINEADISFRTIVINTQHYGVTEYNNLQLKGLADVFGSTIAINNTDLILLGTSLDDTSHIDSSFKTGSLDFSNNYYIRPRDVWVTLRSGKKIRMIVDSDEEDSAYAYYSENFVPNLRKTRVKIGRGYYDTFYNFAFENIDGELLEIENIHVLSETVSGRKR